jgi:membrane-bound lytic murein transglycosylase D
MTPPPLLKVRAEMGPEEKRVFTFTQAFRIGRTEDCEVCIKNEHVSRKHVEVVFENGAWLIRDLQSANGIFVNEERVQSVPLFTALRIRLGIRGPFVEFLVDKPVEQEVPVPVMNPAGQTPVAIPALTPMAAGAGVTKEATHYFGNPEDPSVGDQTRMIRRAFAEVQTKQKRKYGGIIAGLVVCAIAAGGYAFYLHHETQKNRAIAQDMFYSMKSIDVNIANVEKMVSASNNAEGAAEVVRLRSQRKNLDDSYNHLLASLKVYDPKMSEQQKLVLRVARIFGECEVAMPPEFLTEIQNYINKWKSSGRYLRAIRLARDKGYTDTIAHDFLAQGLPPQFFYLGMQESDFQELISGPPTHAGIAKGMWQFIPSTAANYGLKLGPLVDLARPDPADDRHHWDRETKAAAAYIKDLYSTDAQASGLLVMACYNWGEKSVLPLVQSMPKNPRERNFWKLLSLYRNKIPDETYDYVFYIVSAAVIGENPKLFGMDCDNPLSAF